MKNQFFNPLQMKHLMAHKGCYLKAIATPEGLRLCPDFAYEMVHILDPIPVKMDMKDVRTDDGRNKTYCIEEGYQIAKLADALDFTKAEVVEENEVLYFIIGKKKFPMKNLCTSGQEYDLNIQGYTGYVQLESETVEAIKKCDIACHPIGRERYFPQGVYLDPEYGTMVATDGRRMIYHKLRGNAAIGGLGAFVHTNPNKDEINHFILPTWVVPSLNGYSEIHYAYHDYSEPQGKRVSHHVWNYWMLKTDGETYLFNPIEGQFPNYRRVAPEYLDTHMEYTKGVFDFEGMKRFKKLGTHDPMKCTFHDGTCTQMYNGEIELDIGVELAGLPENVDMACNAQFLIDGVKVFGKQSEVDIGLPEAVEGHIVKAVDIASVDGLLHYVIMPFNF